MPATSRSRLEMRACISASACKLAASIENCCASSCLIWACMLAICPWMPISFCLVAMVCCLVTSPLANSCSSTGMSSAASLACSSSSFTCRRALALSRCSASWLNRVPFFHQNRFGNPGDDLVCPDLVSNFDVETQDESRAARDHTQHTTGANDHALAACLGSDAACKCPNDCSSQQEEQRRQPNLAK